MSICRWIVLFLLLPLAGCGSSVEGVYSGTENSWLERIDLRDEQRVELTFMGTTKEGTYEVEKDRVRINNGGDISILRIDDDGCLDGGEVLGKYCKNGSSSGGGSSTSSSSKRSADSQLAGSLYAFGPVGDEMMLESIDDERVRITIDGESESLDYETRGNRISIEGKDGTAWEFTRRGEDLEGGPEGAAMIFRKRS